MLRPSHLSDVGDIVSVMDFPMEPQLVDFSSRSALDDKETIHDLCQEVYALQEMVETYRAFFLSAMAMWNEEYALLRTKINHQSQDIARLQDTLGRVMEKSL